MEIVLPFCPFLCNNRVSQKCVCLQKGITCSSVCLQKKKCNFSLYMIPLKADAGHWMLKNFASTHSLTAHVACQENDVSCDTSASNDFRGLVDSSGYPSDEVNDFERQLQQLFDEVKTMIRMGNENDAMDLLQANYEVVREQISAGGKSIEEAAILDVIALGYMTLGDLKNVESILNMLNEVVDGLKDNEPLLDSVLLHMGSMYSALGRFEKSLLLYHRVLVILESTYGKSSTFLVAPLMGMAKVLGSIGRVTKAVELYHRAITILESNKDAESKCLVIPLFSLGNLLIKEGKATDAESHFNRILSIYMKLYGENNGKVGMALCSLANVKCATGNTEEAIRLYKKALEVIEDTNYVDLDDSTMEKIRIDLAELLHVEGRAREGRELLRECLLITEKHKGKEHPSFVMHLQNLAISYLQSKNFVEAERLLTSCLKIMIKTVGPNDPSISFPMLHLALTLYHPNRDKEAELLALEALRVREKAFREDSLPVGEALDCLVSIRTRSGNADSDELLDLLNRVLSIQEKEFGHESNEVMLTLKKIMFYLDKAGRRDEKLFMEKRLLQLVNKYEQMD